MELQPTNGCLTLFRERAGESEDFLTLTNRGNVTLHWSLQPGICESVETFATDWTTNAYGQSWRVTTERSASPPFSFAARLVSEGNYTSPPVRASLLSPVFHPAPGARLSFTYFIHSELDTQRPGNAYDGGIVEVSTNNGETFEQLIGPYTHRLTGWTYSPWTNGTPCFAGDGSAGWQEASFDLDAFAGQPIRLRFQLGGDNNTDYEGWYLDDIRVGPVSEPEWPAWLACAATSGMIAANRSLSIPIYTLATASSNRQERLPLHLISNDPTAPNRSVDWAFKVRDLPWAGAVTAEQTSTNGEGLVTVNLAVTEKDLESLSLTVAYSADNGSTWSLPELIDAQTLLGPCSLNSASARVDQVTTRLGDASATNSVSLTWDTRATQPTLPLLVTQTLMRVTVSSPYFSAPDLLTPAFLVDNESPNMPTALASTSHAPEIWSGSSLLSMEWAAASDGAGIGGIAYRRRASTMPNDPLNNLPRVPGTTAQLPAPDGSNVWVAVQALDRYGNASGIVRAGPYRVDTVPPSASSAFIQVQRSAFGNYAVGTTLSAVWGGFTDTLSGIAGYYLFPQAGGDFAEPTFCVSTQGLFTVAALDTTNQVPIFAIDRVGNVSAVVSDHLWVLNPAADQDRDGFTAGDEEIAGTDATDATSLFRIGLADVQTATNGVTTLQVWWESVEGRNYTLLATPSLATPSWQPVAGFINVPGTGQTVTNAVSFASPVFLRLIVTLP